MKRALRLGLGVVAGCGVLVILVWLLGRAVEEHETRYSGRTVGYWREQLSSADPAISNRARVIVDTQVIPHLTNQMFADTKDSNLRLALVEQLNALPGRTVYFTPASGRRLRAVNELAALGPRARAASPALFQGLKDELLCGAAANALVKVEAPSEQVVPALLDCMTDPAGHGRADVVEALGDLGPRAKAAVPKLLKLRSDRSSKDIMEAVPEALKKIGADF